LFLNIICTACHCTTSRRGKFKYTLVYVLV
jgi:hypothetical protein